MSLEDTLSGWTGPSSDTEQEKQDRTQRMIREAVDVHEKFKDGTFTVYAKGSYPNNTNVRTDSDVDIAVHCHDLFYWEEEVPGTHTTGGRYAGEWTPDRLRAELVEALRAKFPGKVDTSGSTAIQVNSSSSRVDADVVPCFTYKYFFKSGRVREGTRIFPKSGASFENYPEQHLENGKAKNSRTNTRFKKTVRIMKRLENAMVDAGKHREVQSYFVECLVYNCPDSILTRATWTDTVKGVLSHVWEKLDGDEPTDTSERWLEVNAAKYLFTQQQKWTRQDGRDFAKAAWNYLGLGS